MRILLVKPKGVLATIRGLERFQRLEPLELGYLAAALPPHHQVRALDLRLARYPRRALLRAVGELQPELVGFSGYSHESGAIKAMAQLLKQLVPTVSVVVGGHHATVAPQDYNVPGIDYVVRGEGCGPFRLLVAALEQHESPAGIDNLLLTGEFWDQEAAARWPRFPDPATLPVPRRDLWDRRHYYSVWVSEQPRRWQVLFPQVAMVRTSYGCRMKCSFCVVPYLCGGEHRPRPVAAVADEIAALPQQHVYFADDENFIDERFAGELAEALAQRGVRKRYFAWTRATTVLRSPEILKRWGEIGLDGAFLGFEFSSDDELKEVRKGGTVASNERAHETLRRLGIACHAAFMVRPEYTAEQFERLARYLRDMPPAQCSFTVCTPSPGTPDWQAMQPRIWVEDPYRLYDCMHPLTPTTLPLPEFGRRFASLLATAAVKNPLRTQRRPVRPWELARVLLAEHRYEAAFRYLYRDYPPALASSRGEGRAASACPWG
ncbi:MAG: cobalamin B12-binding domain-containing protein [Thermoanaerobaculaceae bacterium]|nr:cobalamin B12-binding domain-containing protein [Thermoanaerobaculaceae bacterium]